MESSEQYKANRDAKFHPFAVEDDGTRALPCIEIGGAQVYAYVEDGVLRVSVDLDTADGEVFGLYEDSRVPVAVSMGDDTVFADMPSTASWFEASKRAGCTGTGFSTRDDTIIHEGAPCPLHRGC